VIFNLGRAGVNCVVIGLFSNFWRVMVKRCTIIPSLYITNYLSLNVITLRHNFLMQLFTIPDHFTVYAVLAAYTVMFLIPE